MRISDWSSDVCSSDLNAEDGYANVAQDGEGNDSNVSQSGANSAPPRMEAFVSQTGLDNESDVTQTITGAGALADVEQDGTGNVSASSRTATPKPTFRRSAISTHRPWQIGRAHV